MIAHIIQWLVMGMTLSPIEPSESMYSLEQGKLNAGFIFFSLALLCTFIFGRFVCGWGCHIVALQDLCSHWMSKLGVRPKPWRTRLLLWCPLLLALYMFVYPTFERFVLVPAFTALNIPQSDWPFWLSNPGKFPGFHADFIVRDFWATFPPWYIAIPFLLICGFATVYFLGSKAFCSFGCPYGGFFGVIDRVSVGRIVVNDSCEQCGHCTAACTSNVRVHQEVHEFGMVVDPGCMKCLDCVSVCPNDALSFAFAKPALLAKPRHKDPAPKRAARPAMDLSWPEEIIFFVLTIALFLSFRGMLNQIPLLMAAGMAMIAGFGAWKLWRLARDPNVRVQNLQLKLKGRVTKTGVGFALVFALVLACGAWSGWVRFGRLRADLADGKVLTPYDVVMNPGYRPQPADQRLAQAAIDLYRATGPRSEGGFGWGYKPEQLARLAWLHAVMGDLPNAERYLRISIDLTEPSNSVVFGLAQFMSNRGAPAWQVEAMLTSVAQRYPAQVAARVTLARVKASQGREAEAACNALIALNTEGASPQDLAAASELLMDLGQPDLALQLLIKACEDHPDNPLLHAAMGRAMYFTGNRPGAVAQLALSVSLAPTNLGYWGALGQLLDETGQHDEAATIRRFSATLAQDEAAMHR